MSKLDDLIKELCPNGVEYKPLGEICGLLDNKRKPVTKASRIEGSYPYYGANGIQDYVSEYIFDGTFLLVGEDGSVITKSGTPVVTWATGKIWVNNHAHIIAEKKGVSLRYLFHFIQTIDITALVHGNIPKLTGGDFKALMIPVPPLPVQEEIVRILDTFTSLTAELTAELTARRKQYEYYRDSLLTFGDDVEWKTLKELSVHSCSGGTPLKNNSDYYKNGKIPWLRTGEVKFNEIFETEEFITELAVKETAAKWIPKNCVIVAISGATAGRCAINKIPLTTNQHCLNIEINPTNALYKYVYYCIVNQQDELLGKKEGARGDLNSSRILGLKIPIPSIKEQQRIVSILDRFESLCNDITSGLPAEIEARHKQYEYYRDKLLTFKRKEAV